MLTSKPTHTTAFRTQGSRLRSQLSGDVHLHDIQLLLLCVSTCQNQFSCAADFLLKNRRLLELVPGRSLRQTLNLPIQYGVDSIRIAQKKSRVQNGCICLLEQERVPSKAIVAPMNLAILTSNRSTNEFGNPLLLSIVAHPNRTISLHRQHYRLGSL